ncbi:DUF938 domain-containing protein [Lysobacter sp. A3-1-A15]|uniref:DUF938 domain-containing protein n=1 Tax=Novilysobacter viscosus TaxID=3098602 RepID=UPI002ED92160
MPDALPNAPSCERNRDAILAVLQRHFGDRRHVLEVGSGTGQHAVHFAAAMPGLHWHCSDRVEHLPGIRAWLTHAGLPNTSPATELDVATGPWPRPSAAPGARFDAAFSANTLHIMGWPEVVAMFAGLDHALADDAVLAVYGPFNRGGAYSSESNRRFDDWLKARDPRSAIRDFEAVDALARGIGLALLEDAAMPANNRCIVWRRTR